MNNQETEPLDTEGSAATTIKNSMGKNGMVLALFALLTTGLISITYFSTKDQIAAQKQKTLLTTLNAVVDEGSYDNDIQFDCAIVDSASHLGDEKPKHIYRARLKDFPTSVAIETIAPDGYSGKIELLVGIKTGINSEEAIVTGVRVIKHKETPGLGDKIDLRISDWVLAFKDKIYSEQLLPNWAVKKDGGQFDQFTGATITPRAVVNAVKNSAEYYIANQTDIYNAINGCSVIQEANQKGTTDE